MQITFGVESLCDSWGKSVVCIGTFDGVHLGHRAVISESIRQAREHAVPAVVLTFDRHPASILAPEKCPPRISTLDQNLTIFDQLRADIAVVLKFDRALCESKAETFFNEILVSSLGATAIVVGHDFAFGNGREGTPEWLSNRIETTVIQPLEIDGARVSSSGIRKRIQTGDVEGANRLLGREFELHGVVVSGNQLGRQLGYPTANLSVSTCQAIPAEGVYSGTCQTHLGLYRSAISIGTRPTVNGDDLVIEAYLIDYPGTSLYGQSLALCFERRLRGQEKFESLDQLKAQMALDVQESTRKVCQSQ